MNEAPISRLPSHLLSGAVGGASAADGGQQQEEGPVVLEDSSDGSCTLAFPVLGVGYFSWPVPEAVRVLLTSVVECLRSCRIPKLRLLLVVPAPSENGGSNLVRENSFRPVCVDALFASVLA